jgi:hypothetical protein
MSKFNVSRSIGVAVLLAAVLFASASLLPSGQDNGVLAKLAPQEAEAYQVGFSGPVWYPHFWAKIGAGEVVGGVVGAVCARYARGPFSRLQRYCSSISTFARAYIGGRRGFWFELYPTHYRYGFW